MRTRRHYGTPPPAQAAPPVVTTHDLTVSTAGAGAGTVTDDRGQINCPGDCTGTYTEGTVLNLTATPDGTSQFGSWSGAGTGVGPTRTVTMDSDKSVTATFATAAPSVAYVISGTGAERKKDLCTNADELVPWLQVSAGRTDLVTQRSGDGDPHPDSNGNVNANYRRIAIQNGVKLPSDPSDAERLQLGTSPPEGATDWTNSFAYFADGDSAKIFYISFRFDPSYTPTDNHAQIWQIKHLLSLRTSPCLSMQQTATGVRLTQKQSTTATSTLLWTPTIAKNVWWRLAFAFLPSSNTGTAKLQVWASFNESNLNLVQRTPVLTGYRTIYAEDPQATLMTGIYQDASQPAHYLDIANIEVRDYTFP